MKNIIKNQYFYLGLIILACSILLAGGIPTFIYLAVAITSLIGIYQSKGNLNSQSIFCSILIFSVLLVLFSLSQYMK